MPPKKGNGKRQSKTAAERKKTAGVTKHVDDNASAQDIVISFDRGKNFSWELEQVKRQFQHLKRTPMPQDLQPMLASLREEPFDDAAWQFEIKWDGYRSLAYVEKGKVNLRSRNNKSFNQDFPPVKKALEQWPVRAVVDGEIIVLADDGRSDFAALQSWKKQQKGLLRYYVFDLLWLEGIDLRLEPLSVRRAILQKLIPENSIVRFSDSIDEYGTSFFNAARENGLEGIIAKQKNSTYRPGERSRDWYKIKLDKRQEAIICGYTRKKSMDRLFSSLILGVPDGDGLRFIGLVGTGFNEQLQVDLLARLRPLTTNHCPFSEEPPIADFVQWVRPQLVAEVRYTEITAAGVMRHPSFLGLRKDKAAFEINNETGAGKEQQDHEENLNPNVLANGTDRVKAKVDNHVLHFTNLTKIYWPKEKITKGEMIRYYKEMAPWLLTYMKDRPQSLNRFPDGIGGKSFYQKNMAGKVDDWLMTFQRTSDSDSEPKDFLVCTNEASILYMANLGCIELNPWHSRIQNPAYPDWCVIDLDPGRISFRKVIDTARAVRQVLEALNIPSFPKTSGSTGLHIYIPLGGRYKYEQSRQLAELIANIVHREIPKFTSLVRDPSKRTDKIYIDYLQNRPIQTICAPYSIRPKPGATVSTPLDWSEVTPTLKMSHFHISNMQARVKAEGDLFRGVLGKGIDLNEVLMKLATMMQVDNAVQKKWI